MATGSASPEPRGPQPPSLRNRLALAFAALMLAVAVGQAVAVYFTTASAEEALIDRILEEQLQRSVAVYRTQPQFAFPNTGDMTLYVIGDGAPGELPEWLRGVPPVTGRYELYPSPEVEMHVAVLREDDQVFYLAYDVAEHEQRQRDGLAILALSVIVAGGLGLLIARTLSGRLLGDLERLAAAVRGASSQGAPDRDPAQALSGLAGHAETMALARALDDERARARDAIARERDFAAAANHELRTPLMQASSTLELLAMRPLDDQQRAMVARLRAAHAELQSLTEALLRVARSRTGDASAPCALRPLVAGVFERLAADARARSIELVEQLPPEARVIADPGSLDIVLLNLVRNAIRHSGGSRVEVALTADGMRVDDDGQGLRPRGDGDVAPGGAAQPAATEPSLGLGLPIVERVCEANGWTLSVAARPGGGTRAALRIRVECARGDGNDGEGTEGQGTEEGTERQGTEGKGGAG